MLTWFLAYLLVGFIFHFAGVQWLRTPPHESWRVELGAIVFWPITVLVVIFTRKTPVKRGD